MMSDNSASDDDDVVMVEPEIINLDDNDQVHKPQEAIDTIDLDEHPESEVQNNKTEELTAACKSREDIVDSEKEKAFAMLLKNNTLMNKIVQQCLNMSNNAGMSRVISKTLQPLYKDADRNFKQSELFTQVLHKILRNLKVDPDRKFLHIKSLCEELKAKKYRRKVPFVTLTTDLKHRKNPERNCRNKLKDKFKKLNLTAKAKNKTDIIDLDNSDNESVITLIDDNDNNNDNDRNDDTSDDVDDDINIVTETASSDDDSNQSNKENSVATDNTNEDSQECNRDKRVMKRHDKNNEQAPGDNNNVGTDNKTNEDNLECNKDDKLVKKNSNKNEQNPDCNKNISVATPNKATEYAPGCSKGNRGVKSDNNKADHTQEYNKENRVATDNKTNEGSPECYKDNRGANSNNNKNLDTPEYDLLVPDNSAELKHYHESQRVLAIEKQINMYKEMIAELEEEEVEHDSKYSPYIQCDRYKAKIVALYKKLCKITGHGYGNLMKQRVIRLHVVEGHPPGPVRRLERFLNSTIDETGSVPLPDFYDVVRCVKQSNIVDRLGWSKQDIMKEALALFTQCGKALRKKRQKREYKDLMSLVKDKELDDHDPAAEDPQLRARLEENKLIAKANEEEIVQRYVRLQNTPTAALQKQQANNINILASAASSDSDSGSDSDLTPKKKAKTKETCSHNDVNTRESSETNEIHEPIQSSNSTGQTLNQTLTIKSLVDSTIQNSVNSVTSASVNTIEHFCNKVVGTVNTIQNPLSKVQVESSINTLRSYRKPGSLVNTMQHSCNIVATSVDVTQNPINTMQVETSVTSQNTHSPKESFINTVHRFCAIAPKTSMNSLQNPSNTLQQPDNPIANSYINTLQRFCDTKLNTYLNSTQNPNINIKQIGSSLNTIQHSRNSIAESPINTMIHSSNTGVQIPINTTHNSTCEIKVEKSVNYTRESTNTVVETSVNTIQNNNTIVGSSSNTTKHSSSETKTTLQKIGNTNRYVVSINDTTESTAVPKVINNNVQTQEVKENVTVKSEPSVKQEPIDIQSLLDELGDNYTATVFDIEDPFLVIEISDSSDDEDL